MTNISGLYTALSGMNAQRRVLDTTAHNIANHATPGYHRQRVELKPAGLAPVAAVFAGTGEGIAGVDAEQVTRIVDQLAEDRLVRQSAAAAGTEQLASELSRIETIFPEPSENGISAVLEGFFSGWSDLAARPTDLAMRTQTLEQAQDVVSRLRAASTDLDGIETTARGAVVSLAADANDLAGQIAQLNSAIAAGHGTAHDLVDQRDVVLRQLADLTGAVARPGTGGQIDVTIGGRAVVSGTIAQRLDGAGGELRWASDGAAVAAPSGRAGALAQTINVIVPRYRIAVDGVAEALVDDVNALHSAGYDPAGDTGWNFFDPAGTTAASIRLSDDVLGQPERLAAGAPVLPGPSAPGRHDGEQARAMSGLVDQLDGAGERYQTMVAGLGVDVRSAVRREAIQADVVFAAEAERDSISSVSLDEEMATLMASQRAYEASARVLTVVDSMLGTLIERTGLAGR